MTYYINDNNVTLTELRIRIENTDMVPSREYIKTNIDSSFSKLSDSGIKNLAMLRNTLKTPKKILEFSKTSQIDENYLILLRREIESYFPKIYSINDFTFIPYTERNKLTTAGIDNSKKGYDNLIQYDNLKAIAKNHNIEIIFLEKVFSLCSLVRIQWASPLFAFILHEVGYHTPDIISKANSEELYTAVNCYPNKEQYFKVKIGLRDIKRLIYSAGFVC